MQYPAARPAIDASAWKAARPAAGHVRPLAATASVAAFVVVVGGALALDNVLLLLAAPPAAAWAAWRGGRHLLAARAVRRLPTSDRGLGVVAVAELVAGGTTVAGGVSWLAVEDQDSVVLTTTAGRGFTGQLPLSVITNLGNSGGGGV